MPISLTSPKHIKNHPFWRNNYSISRQKHSKNIRFGEITEDRNSRKTRLEKDFVVVKWALCFTIHSCTWQAIRCKSTPHMYHCTMS